MITLWAILGTIGGFILLHYSNKVRAREERFRALEKELESFNREQMIGQAEVTRGRMDNRGPN